MFAHRHRRHAPLVAVLAGLFLGCSDTTAPSLESGAIQFSRDITLPELGDALSAGPSRIEIEILADGGLVAREVELETDDELFDREEIESPVAGVESGASSGTLILALGNLRVDFDETTRFRSEGSDDLTVTAFVDRIDAALAEGRMPPVEAKRAPPLVPQDPDDPSFFATELRLNDEADEPEIEINVDGDNLVTNNAPPPDGWIAVLGLMIELRVSEGVTEIEAEMDDLDDEFEFEGLVAQVDVVDQTVTLQNGTVIRLVDRTKIDREPGDDDQLHSLQEVAAALDAGQLVEAEGEGIAETTDPLVVIAIEVEFEIEDEDDGIPGAQEFEGQIDAVNLTDRTFTLSGGTIVRFTDETRVAQDGDLLTLEAVAQALNGPDPVRAEGDALVDDVGPPLGLRALSVKFEVDEPAS